MFNRANGDGGARLHERSTEEALRVAAVRDHMQRDRDRTRTLAPTGGNRADTYGRISARRNDEHEAVRTW